MLNEEFQSLLDYAKTWIPSLKNCINSIRLRNNGGFVARMVIYWSYTDSSGKTTNGEHCGNSDICVAAERSIQLSETKIPEGATVWLKADIRAGKDKTASERFVYRKSASKQAKYVVSGTTLKNSLRFEGVV